MYANRHFRLHEFQWAPVRCLVFKTIFRTNLLGMNSGAFGFSVEKIIIFKQ